MTSMGKTDKIKQKVGEKQMKLTQLQYFCEVYRQRNVSRAAEKLNISQPSISAAIKELEGEFGIALFPGREEAFGLRRRGTFFMNTPRAY